MATGWACDGAVQDQIDDTVKDAVSRARARLVAGPGALQCMECGEDIPEKRRQAVPGVQTCVACQSARDARPAAFGFNRAAFADGIAWSWIWLSGRCLYTT